MNGLRRSLLHIKNNLAVQCKLWYYKIVVNDVVKHKITTEEMLMITRKELVDNIITWDIIIAFYIIGKNPNIISLKGFRVMQWNFGTGVEKISIAKQISKHDFLHIKYFIDFNI